MNLKNLGFSKTKIILCLIALLAIVIAVSVIASIIIENNKMDDAFKTLSLFDNVRDEDVYDAYQYASSKKGFADRLILEISTEDYFDSVVNFALLLNEKEYTGDSRVKTAFLDRIKKEVSNCSLSEELAIYAMLENAAPWNGFNSNQKKEFVYANINDIISKEDLLLKIKNELQETDKKDYSIKSNTSTDYDYTFGQLANGDLAILDTNTTSKTYRYLFYKDKVLFNNNTSTNSTADKAEQDFISSINWIYDTSNSATVHTYFNEDFKNSLVVFDVEEYCIYTSRGPIKYDKSSFC